MKPRPDVNVGRALRKLRSDHDISIRGLAELSGLNANTLSLIENGKTSPSVSTLQQIAGALQVPITAFFETEALPQAIVYQRSIERQAADFFHGQLADMGAGFAQPGLQPFIVTLSPNPKSECNPIVHTGTEFVYCLEGKIGYNVDGQAFILEPGDSLLFEAHLPHCWRNAGDTVSRSLLLLCPADERDRPDARHFDQDR